MKLQAKLALALAGATALAVIVMSSTLFAVAADEQRDSTDRFLAERIESVREGRLPNRQARASQDFDRDDLLVRVAFANGEVLLDDGLPEPRERSSRRDDGRADFRTIEIDGDRYRMATVDFQRPGGRQGTLQLAANIERDERSINRLRNRVLVFGGLGVVLAGLLGAWWARRLSKPIVEVAGAAQQMSLRSDLPTRIHTDRSDEVGDLARSFNDMVSALEVSREQQQRLVADASHELRTPLTSLRLKVELLNSTPNLDATTRAELLDGTAIELERLTALVNELVELASDPASGQEPAVALDLHAVAADTVERLRRTSGRTIQLRGSPTPVVGRDRMLRRAMSNLIDNAVKYAPADQPIEVTVSDHTVTVRDHGPGIADDDLEHVFDRFFRANEARTQPGNGIGLAIVDRVATLHGGVTFAHNAPDGGAVVGFTVDPNAAT